MSKDMKQIEKGLERYYERTGRTYRDPLHIGKFVHHCYTKGIHNDKELEVELNKKPNECRLVNFDKDFPLNNGKDRATEIYYIIKYCWKDKTAFAPPAKKAAKVTDYIRGQAAAKSHKKNKESVILKYRRTGIGSNKEQIDAGLARYYKHKADEKRAQRERMEREVTKKTKEDADTKEEQVTLYIL